MYLSSANYPNPFDKIAAPSQYQLMGRSKDLSSWGDTSSPLFTTMPKNSTLAIQSAGSNWPNNVVVTWLPGFFPLSPELKEHSQHPQSVHNSSLIMWIMLIFIDMHSYMAYSIFLSGVPLHSSGVSQKMTVFPSPKASGWEFASDHLSGLAASCLAELMNTPHSSFGTHRIS